MKKPYIFPLLLGSLVLTGCANGQIDAMQMRLNQQEQQIRLLNSQLSGVQPAQADTWAQVQSLRQEMSAVKGQIDDFNNATAAAGGLPGLAQRVNNHEAALQAIATQYRMELSVAAALDYEQVISKYGSSGKAASAYLKQGMCCIKAGKKDAGKVRLQELIKKFPKSPEATRATQLMKDNKM